jgi:hypothetical protein
VPSLFRVSRLGVKLITEEVQPASASGNTSNIKIFFIFGIINRATGTSTSSPHWNIGSATISTQDK